MRSVRPSRVLNSNSNILGLGLIDLFYLEYPVIKKNPSLLGHIKTYIKYGYSYNEYVQDMRKVDKSPIPVIKVWTGR